MKFENWFLVFSINILKVYSQYEPENRESIVFDQRQNGKYNIHVSFKDVSIITLGEDDLREKDIGTSGSNDDYYYDDNDLTVKPGPDLLKPTSSEAPISSLLQFISNSTYNEEPVYNSTSGNWNYTSIPAESVSEASSSTTKKPSVTILSENTTDPGIIVPPIRNRTQYFHPELHIPVKVIMDPPLGHEQGDTFGYEHTEARLEPPRRKNDTKRQTAIKRRRIGPAYRKTCSHGYDESGNCLRRRSSLIGQLLTYLVRLPHHHGKE